MRPDRRGVKPDFVCARSVARMCSSRVLLVLESSARDCLRSHCSRANLCELSPVGGCKYKRYVRYVSTDEQLKLIKCDTCIQRGDSGLNSNPKCLKLVDNWLTCLRYKGYIFIVLPLYIIPHNY